MFLKRRTKFLAGGGGLLLIALAAAGCGGGGGSSGPPKTASGKPATLGFISDNLGKLLVDSQGRTLYLFTADHGSSDCTGACAVNWPPLLANGKATVGSGAKTSLVSTTARGGGKTQLTYNGHPLYRFANDTQPGQTNGEGLNAFGGNWYAISPAGSQILAPAPTSGGGGGY
jgi:predicted lipoprotein with Yx(FWY)xxD motif